MAEQILTPIIHLIMFLISSLGYGGVLLAMAIESASIPLPSEVIMPFAGFLVSQGQLQFWGIVLAGSSGCLLGSWSNWWLGKRYGEQVIRQLLRRYGKFVFIFEYELDEAIDVFHRHGEAVIFLSRLLPVVRTFISLPAGIAKMNFRKFSIYTFIGSFFWSLVLAWLGVRLGENWAVLGKWFHRFDAFIAAGIIFLLIWYPWHKIKKQRRYQRRRETI